MAANTGTSTIIDFLISIVKDPKLIENGAFDYTMPGMSIKLDGGETLSIRKDDFWGYIVHVDGLEGKKEELAKAAYEAYKKQQEKLNVPQKNNSGKKK